MPEAKPPKYPRSQRTMFPQHHTPPLYGKRFDAAKEAESERQKHDPYYITAEEARALPPEAADQPHIRSRVEYSRNDWPENKANATIALGPLPPGEGQTIDERPTEASEIFQGERVGGNREPTS